MFEISSCCACAVNTSMLARCSQCIRLLHILRNRYLQGSYSLAFWKCLRLRLWKLWDIYIKHVLKSKVTQLNVKQSFTCSILCVLRWKAICSKRWNSIRKIKAIYCKLLYLQILYMRFPTISEGSDQHAHTRSLIIAFAGRLDILWILSYWPNIICSF